MPVSSLVFLSGLAFATFVLSYAMTHAMCRGSWMIDTPNHRSSHQRPTPRSGGIAIVVAAILAVGVYLWSGQADAPAAKTLILVGVSYALLVGICLLDDLKSMGMKVKLASQVIAALLITQAGFTVQTADIPFFGPISLGFGGDVLTIFWIVALTNAFNFMDGLDSLAGGQAVIVAFALMAIAYLAGGSLGFAIGAIILAASLGFLLHNLPPAKIFMGDTGSQFLGFTFAVLGVSASQITAEDTTLTLVPILLFSFLWDTAFTLIRRKLAGDPIAAHRTHLYQLLNRLGWSHRQVASLYHGFAVLQAALALAVYSWRGLTAVYAIAFLTVVFGVFSWVVVRKARQGGLI